MKPVQLKVVSDLLLQWGTPVRQTIGAAGYDLFACIPEDILVPSDATVAVPTGFALHIEDPNVVAKIYPRSGISLRNNITLANAVGVIDSDYQGEIKVLLRNESWEDFVVRPGDRIAQMLFEPVLHPPLAVVLSFSSTTERGEGGFGSTGEGSTKKAELTTDSLGVA